MSMLVKELHAFFLADLVLTVLTLKDLVGTFPKPLGIPDQGHFPAYQQHY
jgi:hypothetical protein